MASSTSTAVAIRQFQSETDLICATPEPKSVSLAIWALVGLLVAAVVLMMTVTVDKIVASKAGKIVSVDQLVVLEALDPSIIKSIDVKEGDTVAKGQILATLDATFTSADLSQMKSQVLGLKAEIARATAEVEHQPFNPTMKPDDPSFSHLQLQKNLFDKRAAQYNADVLSFDEKIKQQQVTIAKLESDVASYKQREKISLQVEGMRDTLFKSGSSSLLNLLTATDARLELQRTMQFDNSSLLEARHQVASIQADRDSYIQKFLSDATQEVVTARNNLDSAVASLEKAAKHEDLVKVTADAPGVVLTLAKVSVGSVLKQGDPLLTLMPLGSPIEAEVDISTRDIGFVRVGDNVRLKIDAYNSSEHGYAEGKVIWISADAFTTDNDNKPTDPYYKARVSVSADHFTGVPANFRLIPGLTLTADINVGTRLLGRYIVGGALRGGNESMREP
jgi:HlyD family secretion protein